MGKLLKKLLLQPVLKLGRLLWFFRNRTSKNSLRYLGVKVPTLDQFVSDANYNIRFGGLLASLDPEISMLHSYSSDMVEVRTTFHAVDWHIVFILPYRQLATLDFARFRRWVVEQLRLQLNTSITY